MKKTILTIIQIVVTLGILFWIFHDPHKRTEMWAAISHAQPLWIGAGIFSYFIVEILAAARWQILLRVQGIRIGWFRLASLLMIGVFFNQFMPGGTGGDVVKIFYLLKETPGKKAQALLAVLIDRVIGLFGLVLVAGVVIALRWDWLTQGQPVPHFNARWIFSPTIIKAWLNQIPGTSKLLYILLAVLGSSVIGIVFSFTITGVGLIQKLPHKMPFREKLVELSIAYNLYARAWKASLLAIFASIGVHIASFYVFYAAAKSLRAGIPLLDFFAVMPIINTLASLPISVGGTGVREGLFQSLLSTLCNVKEADAVVISLTGFAMVLFWGVVGGVVYLFYRPTEHAKLSDIQHEVEELEHKIAKAE